MVPLLSYNTGYREAVVAAGGSTHVEIVGSDVTPQFVIFPERMDTDAGGSTHVEIVGSDFTPQFVIFPERMDTDGTLYCRIIPDIARTSHGSWWLNTRGNCWL
ncbi:hypothetical protein J6590_098296 [Homalodisca vitripennis]|nr:hypothetical protein J6590_098296 [Homalodisca vitripennis]